MLSDIASIITVLQLTGEVIKYLKDIKYAPKECRDCATEASNLYGILINLLYHLNLDQTGGAWFTAVRNLNVENGPLDQYKQALEQLRSTVEIQDGVQKVKQRLLWKFSKEEVASILARMERLKSLVNIALEMDHLKLSLAIKEDTLIVRNTLPLLQAHVVAIQDTQNLQWDALKLQERHAIIEWLSPTDFPAQQHDIITRRHEGTGQWFLDSPEFKRWLQGSDKTLFCPGIPGAGKTMMAAITVDHLCRTIQGDDIRVAYLFCSYKIQADQSATTLLAAILKQLVQSLPNIAAPVKEMYDFHSRQRSRPSFDEIFCALQSICSSYPAVYIIVDALDECANRDGARNRLVNKLCDLQVSTDMRLLFTSRSLPEITSMFQSALILEVHASEEDVRCFVTGQMPRLSKCVQRDDGLKQAVQDKIVKAADGM
ncbi:hypothetical protein OIDMADRAFT_43209 [Oidiodendron maius Zn]|uniref:Nephrocystin 3-like N-terminal domain-containing protein n=1 Tax=Oidiodendron maius (strain Zn) TaxID=913774 RepID=A0A0C3DBD1_OIDMZ|nr:hypothetical protein OIDMADRAFT_43209 [Oidiodendron maius Zn]